MSKHDEEHYVVGKNVRDINIRDFFEVIKRRLWIIVLVTIIATSAGYYMSTLNNSLVYQTSTRIIIESDSEYMKTLMVMIKDPIIMEKVKEELNLSRSPESIAGQVAIERIDESQVVKIDVTDQDPKMAMNIANATARSFKNEVGNILDFDEVQLLSEAKENNFPINENTNKVIVIAFIFGLVTGFGLVFLLDALDDTVNKDREVEEILGVPVIGVISNMKSKKISVKKEKKIKPEVEMRGETVGINK